MMRQGFARAGLSGLLMLLAACGGGGDSPEPPEPDPAAALSVAPASVTLAAGTSATATVTVARSGGFTQAVTVGATGMPTGVTVTAGTIAADATTQVLTVTAAADASPGTATMSITGTAPGITIAPLNLPLTVTAAPLDTDGDGLADSVDADDDNDTVPDGSDPYPLDASRSMSIQPAFPKVAGVYQLPDHPATRQLAWVLAQLAAADTSEADINAHFAPQVLATAPASQWRSLLQQMRTRAPAGIVVDLIAATPVSVTALVGTPGVPASGMFFTLRTTYGTERIVQLGASNYALNGSVQYPADAALTLAQAADKFTTLAPQTALLVARITDHRCVPLEQRSGDVPRATGSIFKNWILGALGEAVDEGVVDAQATIALNPAHTASAGSVLGYETAGTLLPVSHLATLMMGNSDNTSTDHLHALLGRTRLEAALTSFGNLNPQLLTPFLSINEQFNLFRSPTTEVNNYVSGTEQFQRTYVDTVLAPKPPDSGNVNNLPQWIPSSWQASAMDVCAAYAGMRQFSDQSSAFRLIDRALSAGVAQPFVRDHWERAWYKGGSLETATGYVVLTHSWMLESDARGAFVVVAMTGNPAVGVDQFQVQSLTGRVLQLLRETP